ncbi:MAG TPA: transcriptional regulator [Candidatus Pacearchaeota archaeon]|nr:transcriptional regulator [Candidatus Pacearchaeota archaeon]
MINKQIHKISEKDTYKAYKIFFGTLVSEPRIKMINLLRNKRKSVSEIMSELKMNQTSVSHNLARLKKCGFVNVEVKGKFRYYSLNNQTIKPLMSLIDKHMSDHCVHILNKSKLKGGKRK